MPPIQLPDTDKATIRDLTEEAIANGLGKLQLAEMRRTLAESVGVSRRSLGSVSAYVLYSATQAIDECGLAGRVTQQQLVQAARLTRGSSTFETDVDLMAAGWGVPAGELRGAIAHYEAYYRNRPGGTGVSVTAPGQPERAEQPKPVDETPAVVEPAASPTECRTDGEAPADGHGNVPAAIRVVDEDDTPDEELGERGDTANYDTAAKREWRAFWADQIRSRLTPSRLREAKVICLPGRHVEPEVSKYLAMGVRPENIYAVEGSRRVRDEFEANARRLGIRYFSRPLDKVLPELDVGFDIVNYDFHGQFCKGHLRAAHLTPLAGDAVLIYNAMGKREDREIQSALRETVVASYEAKRQAVSVLKGDTQKGVEGRLLQLMYTEHGNDEDLSLHALRTGVCRNLFAQGAGKYRAPLNRRLLEEAVHTVWSGVTDDDLRRNIDHGLRESIDFSYSAGRHWIPRALAQFWDVLGETYSGRILQGCDPLHLGLALWHSIYSVPYYRGSHLVYDYLSETKPGGGKSPFFTSVSHMMRPDAVAGRHTPALEWSAVLLRHYQNAVRGAGKEAEGPCCVVDRSGRPRSTGEKLEWHDSVCVMSGERTIAEITLGDLREAMLGVTAARRQYDLHL